MIKSYLELLLEKKINESVIYFSPKFRKVLNIIDDKVSSELLKVEGDDIKPDITFIDFEEDKEGYISFTTMKNAMKKIKKANKEDNITNLDFLEKEENKEKRINYTDEIYKSSGRILDKDSVYLKQIYTRSRNLLKVGKFANKIYPGKFTQQEIEQFTNKFKSKSFSFNKEELKIVEGEDIAFWYKAENYESGSGQLSNSCMKNNSSSTFDIYVDNPESCKMLILIKNDKLLARALIWKLNSIYGAGPDEPEYFMDRQYSNSDSDVEKMRNYAKEKGWAFKTNNNHYSFRQVTYKDKVFYGDMKVILKDIEYSYFPYMDTFRRYDPYTHTLYNDNDRRYGGYLLEDTSGGFENLEDVGIWSEHHGRNVLEENAVWSEDAESFLDRDEAQNVDGNWYATDSDSIVYDDYRREYIHVNNAMYSEDTYETFHVDDSIQIIDDVDFDGEPKISDGYYHKDYHDVVNRYNYDDTPWFHRLSDEWKDWEEYHALSDIFMIDSDADIILRQFKIETFKYKDFDEKLRPIDAQILGLSKKDSEEEPYIIDDFKYNDKMSGNYLEIFKRGESKINELNKQLKGEGQLKINFPDLDKEKEENKIKEKIKSLKLRLSEIEEYLEYEDIKIPD